MLRGFFIEQKNKNEKLSYDECCEGEFLAGNGPAAALEFVVEVGKATNDAAEERLSPATATLGGVALLAEHEVVLSKSLGGIFGAHLFCGERHEVEKVYGVAVKGVYDSNGVIVLVAVKDFV